MRTSYCVPQSQLTQLCPSDILSFYKEEMDGEEDNYIHERALASGSSTSGALQEVIDETVAAVKRVRGILGDGPGRAAWENFAAGYIRVHTDNPRYRLKDILGNEYIMDMASF